MSPLKLTVLIAMVLMGTMLHAQTIAIPPSNFGEPGAGISAENPYFISNLSNLRWLSETTSAWGSNSTRYYYRQTADIDATETITWNEGLGFSPIGYGGEELNDFPNMLPFLSNYDGGGFTISNLYINRPSKISVGLFGRADRANINNIILDNVFVIGDFAVGGLVGVFCIDIEDPNAFAHLYNNHVNGVVEGRMNVGGLAGYVLHYATEVFNNSASVNVTGHTQVGGLIGLNAGAICKESFSTGNVSGVLYVGGAIGLTFLGAGEVYNSPITDIFATGNVIGSESVGGLVGYCWAAIIDRSYATGNVMGTTHVGGLIGTLAPFVIGNGVTPSYLKNSVYDIQTTGINDTVGEIHPIGAEIINSTGRNTIEMKTLSTYTDLNWDFANIWEIDAELNNGYPFLRNAQPLTDYDVTIPKTTSMLYANFPNPFNPSTTISFYIEKAGNVCLDIFNVKGQKILTLVNEYRQSGNHSIIWNGKDISGREVVSGIYFYRLVTNDYTNVKKMVMLK